VGRLTQPDTVVLTHERPSCLAEAAVALPAVAAVLVLVTDLVRRDAAATPLLGIATAFAAGGIVAALRAAAETLALAGPLLVTVFAAPSVIVLLFMALVAATFVGAALLVLVAAVALEPTSFDQDIVSGGESEIGAGERDQCHTSAHRLFQRRASILDGSEHARPVIEPTVAHASSLLASQASGERLPSATAFV